MTDLKSFFDNLNCFFEDEEDYEVDIPASAHKDANGEIEEIRIYIPEYEQFLFFGRDGKVTVLDVNEERERVVAVKKQIKQRARKERFEGLATQQKSSVREINKKKKG